MIPDGVFVNWAIILDRAQGSVTFLDEEERCCVVAFGWTNSTSLEMFFNELLELLLFQLGKADETAGQ